MNTNVAMGYEMMCFMVVGWFVAGVEPAGLGLDFVERCDSVVFNFVLINFSCTPSLKCGDDIHRRFIRNIFDFTLN
jgi:hypothetical protein